MHMLTQVLTLLRTLLGAHPELEKELEGTLERYPLLMIAVSSRAGPSPGEAEQEGSHCATNLKNNRKNPNPNLNCKNLNPSPCKGTGSHERVDMPVRAGDETRAHTHTAHAEKCFLCGLAACSSAAVCGAWSKSEESGVCVCVRARACPTGTAPVATRTDPLLPAPTRALGANRRSEPLSGGMKCDD
jgi:hypothetical protein